ncbi:hypothetical protein [Amycolatopsis sp. CB00013]|uniref:hypothetical protein n=1 Tax=Amycolatopsis sp. CB00013 TaxID=1703945 RepID=UPI00093B87EE|nr:hypothetical protein [Amycolatopsis sp. CB00013]
MADLRWDEVRSFFDPDLMGAFPDVFVPDTSAEDWQRVFDLVEARGWQREFRQGGVTLPLSSAAEGLLREPDAGGAAGLSGSTGARDLSVSWRPRDRAEELGGS